MGNVVGTGISETTDGQQKGGKHMSDCVGASSHDAANDLTSLDSLVDTLLAQSGLTKEQMMQKIDQLPPDIISLVQQPESADRFRTIIGNIAQFYASESKHTGSRTTYPLGKIFENAQLNDEMRCMQAGVDLHAAGLTQGMEGSTLSNLQQDALLKVHQMYPEKGVFELNRQEKWGKYQALLADGVFDKQQAKLLLDRGYAGFLGNLLGGISKIANLSIIAVGLLILFLFIQLDGCSALSRTKNAVGGTADVVTDVVVGAKDIVSPVFTEIKGLGKSLSTALGTDLARLAEVNLTITHYKKRLATVRNIIAEEDEKTWFFDTDVQDAAQTEEEELEKKIYELEKQRDELELEIETSKIYRERFGHPIKNLRDRTAAQWQAAKDKVSSLGDDTGGGGGGAAQEDLDTEAVDKVLEERTSKDEL